MDRRTFDDGTRVAATGDGEWRYWIPAPGIMLGRVIGHLSQDLALAVMADTTPVFKSRRNWKVFGDWTEMTGYDTEARIELTKWVAKLRPQFDSVMVLQRSKIVAMGLAAANLVLGGWVQATTDAVRFHRAVDLALGESPNEKGDG